MIPSDLLEREGVYVTRGRTNVRFGPGTRHDVAQTLPAGHRVKVVAETRSGWYMLETGDTVIGFIFGRLLDSAPVSVPYGGAADSPTPKPALPYGGSAEDTGAQERPALPYGPGGKDEPAVPLEQGAAEPTRIEVERQCREISITLDDGRSQTHTVCRDADGRWRRPDR